MRKIIVSAWVTLDGVYDADSMQEWFMPFNSDEKMEYIKGSILHADALLIGRTTYEMFEAYWPNTTTDDEELANQMNSMQKYVVSTTLEKAEWNNSGIINTNIIEEIKKLKKENGNEIQIPGSATLVQSLMKENLIDEFRFLVHPIILGNGKHFFKDGMKTAGMELVKTRMFDKGVVLLCYAINT